MTELEQKFFEVFGIEPKKYYDYTKAEIEDVCENCFISHQCISQDCCNNENLEREIDNIAETFIYPPITPEIVLGLIEILIHKDLEFACNYSNLHKTYSASKEDGNENYLACIENTLERAILLLCIHSKDKIQEEVQQLFRK